MKFQPGQSGNPGGRPALPRDYRQRCQLFMTKTGWAALESLAANPKARDHLRAIELLAAYAYGRPTQPVAGDADPDAAPVRVTVTFDRNAEDAEPPAT